MKTIECLRCKNQMKFMSRESIQLGEYGLFLKHLSNLMSGCLEVDIYRCPKCGKLEFFEPKEDE